jgi:hypothetical protein
MLEDEEKDGNIKEASAIKQHVLRPDPCVCSRRRRRRPDTIMFVCLLVG